MYQMIDDASRPNDLLVSAQSADMETLVRLEVLKQFRDAQAWDDAELARRVKRSPQQVSAWMNGRRPIGEKLARYIEEQLGLARFYLDERPGSSGTLNVREASPPLSSYYKSRQHPPGLTARDQSGMVAIPLLDPSTLDLMNEANDSAALRPLETHLTDPDDLSAYAKALTVTDDSMAPTITTGDRLVVDPKLCPRAGDVVIVRTTAGEYLLRSFRPRTASVFEAVPANDSYATLRSDHDGLEVVAVMVEHTRRRRR